MSKNSQSLRILPLEAILSILLLEILNNRKNRRKLGNKFKEEIESWEKTMQKRIKNEKYVSLFLYKKWDNLGKKIKGNLSSLIGFCQITTLLNWLKTFWIIIYLTQQNNTWTWNLKKSTSVLELILSITLNRAFSILEWTIWTLKMKWISSSALDLLKKSTTLIKTKMSASCPEKTHFKMSLLEQKLGV